MNRCSRHPGRETLYRCMKHEVYTCTACLHCRDPEIYCKFRSSCAIHFIKKNGDLAAETPSTEGQALEAGG